MYDYSDERARWKLLSRELQLKQEVINRTKADLDEKSNKLKEKGQEMVKYREELQNLEQECYEVQSRLNVELRIQNSIPQDLPKKIIQLPLHDLRNHLLSSSQTYMSLQTQTREFKDKIQKVADQVQDMPKMEAQLRQKESLLKAKQREMQKIEKVISERAKYDEIINKQSTVIAQLEAAMERVVSQKIGVEKHDTEAIQIQKEIEDLSNQITQATYFNQQEQENGEQREIERLETQSIPQLKDIYDDLQKQIEKERLNPMVKYGFSTEASTIPSNVYDNQMISQKYPNYHREFFMQENGEEGTWQEQKVRLENQLQQETIRYEALQAENERAEQDYQGESAELDYVLRQKQQKLDQLQRLLAERQMQGGY